MKSYKMPLLVCAVLFAMSGVFVFGQPKAPRPSKEVKPEVTTQCYEDLKAKTKTLTPYRYKLNTYSLTDMQNIGNWEVGDPACGEVGDIPCVILFDGNLSQLDTYLDGFSSEDAITAVAAERKASE